MTTFNKYLDNPTVRITLFVGGIDEKEQFRALEEGVDIVVGTLQKLMDYVRRGKLVGDPRDLGCRGPRMARMAWF